MENTIYKILTHSQWEEFQKSGTFRGSDLDLQDGYIHMSTNKQYPRIRQKFFANESSVILVHIDSSTLTNLKWEESPRSGEVYPHLYGNLTIKKILKNEIID